MFQKSNVTARMRVRGPDRGLPYEGPWAESKYTHRRRTSRARTGILPAMSLPATEKSIGNGTRGLWVAGRRPHVAGTRASRPFGRRGRGLPRRLASHPTSCRSTSWRSSAWSAGSPTAGSVPNATVSRQQFAKMVVLAMRIPVSEADVSRVRRRRSGRDPRALPRQLRGGRRPARASPPAPEGRVHHARPLLARGRRSAWPRWSP